MTPLLRRVSTDRSACTAVTRPGTAVATVAVSPAPPDAVVLAVCGEVDAFSSPPLRDRLLDHVRPSHPKLVVDLTGVSFFGAAGLSLLVAVRNAAGAAGIRMCLVARTRVVLRPLEVTRLDGVFEVCPDIACAWLRMDRTPAQTTGGQLGNGVLPQPRAGHSAPSPA